jgi:hypothetical protein
MKDVSLVSFDFTRIAGLDDAGVLSYFDSVCRLSKNPIVPPAVKSNHCRIARTPQSVTIHFLWVDPETTSEEETFRFSFVPGPKFS